MVRNDVAQARQVKTAAGQLEVRAPRVNERREGSSFISVILPPWARRSPKVAEVLPALHLRGISTKDFVPALAEFFGSGAGISASTLQRLTRDWSQEMQEFAQRDLSQADYVYLWADGVHFNIRLEKDQLCCLVLLGVRADGHKELVAVGDGFRESQHSWAEVLRDLKRRGMRAPMLAIGDGALGFWSALKEVFPESQEQRCWVHKIANVHRCPAQEPATEGQGGAARDHGRRVGTGTLPGELQCQVSQGGGEAGQGPGGVAHPPQLPGRTLGPSAMPSSPPSPRPGSALARPRERAAGPQDWPWPTSSWTPPRLAGAASTLFTWWR